MGDEHSGRLKETVVANWWATAELVKVIVTDWGTGEDRRRVRRKGYGGCRIVGRNVGTRRTGAAEIYLVVG